MTEKIGSRSITDRFKEFLRTRAKRRLNEPDGFGDTPLHRACYKNDPGRVRLLLRKGADVNTANIVGNTALHAACSRGHSEIIRLLIEHGANVNARNNSGLTPLHRACREGKPAAARLLMASGACVEARGSDGYSPLELVLGILRSDNPAREELIELFREYAPDLVMEQFCARGPQP